MGTSLATYESMQVMGHLGLKSAFKKERILCAAETRIGVHIPIYFVVVFVVKKINLVIDMYTRHHNTYGNIQLFVKPLGFWPYIKVVFKGY